MAEKVTEDSSTESSSPEIPEDIFYGSPVAIREETVGDVHNIYFEFYIANAFLIEGDWVILEEVTTTCEKLQTSWELRIIFDKMKNFTANLKGPKVVSGDARLKRTDPQHQPACASMEMKSYHEKFGQHTTIEKFEKRFKPGGVTFLYISNIVPSGRSDLLLNEKIHFGVCLSIRECHAPLNPPPETPEKKSPPKRRKTPPIDKRWHHTFR